MRAEPKGIWAYAPDEIRKIMFLPLMKNTLLGGIVGLGIRQNYSFLSYNKILCPSPLLSAPVEIYFHPPP